jgi:sterol desaturase/sphingolipid hydroxylase (fatty acid hydroxylase superfamily)
VHHSARRLDSTTGLRMHAADFLQLSALPILLFGVLLDTAAWSPWVLTAVFGIGAVFDGFQHANLRLPWSSPLVRAWSAVLNNPHFHAWHHTVDGAEIDGNYGNTLTIWDRLFGSDVTRPTLPRAFGVAADQGLREDPLGWQLLRPARPA